MSWWHGGLEWASPISLLCIETFGKAMAGIGIETFEKAMAGNDIETLEKWWSDESLKLTDIGILFVVEIDQICCWIVLWGEIDPMSWLD